MKTVEFTVAVSFSDDIRTKGDIRVIAENIFNSLAYECQTFGIAPEDSDYFTTRICVTSDDIKITLDKKIK